MVKHIVTFKFEGNEEERLHTAQKFKAALMKLPDLIPVLEKMEVGINENKKEDWDIVLTATVPTLADVETYATHPAHIAAASIIKPMLAARACVDYKV